jgi:hypothetical protein
VEATGKFVQSIAKRRDRIRKEFDNVRFVFLLNNLQMGLTLAHMALGLPRGSEKRMRYVSKASCICDSVAHLSRALRVRPEDSEHLHESLGRLREAVERLDADF